MKFSLIALLWFSLLAGCTSVVSDSKTVAHMAPLKHFFVEQRLNDNHGIDELIVKELQALGRDASSGPLTMMPDNTEAVISYQDNWAFDFTTHMVGLEVLVRLPRKAESLATGHYSNNGISRNTPAEIVHEVISTMFKSGSAPASHS
jgi:hypothetical protein